jgi:hypothetical protein
MILWSPKSTKTYVPFPSLKTKKKKPHILCHFDKKLPKWQNLARKKKKKKKKITSAGFNIRLEFHQMEHFPVQNKDCY